MSGYVHVALGDITLLACDAIAYSTDRALSEEGQLTAAFVERVAGFAQGYAQLKAARRRARPAQGTSFWIDTTAPVPRGVVVALAAGGRGSRAEIAERTVTSALECARENLERLGPPRPWLVALPGFLTGDGGARQDRLLVAEPQLRAASTFVERHPDIDVAFVLYTESTYQVYLEARRRAGAARAAAEVGPEPPEELVEAIRARACVLFAGSGICTGSGLPSWAELIAELASDLGIPREEQRTDLEYFLDLAQWYRDEGRRPSLSRRIGEKFSSARCGAKPTLAHFLLASLPIRWIVTTNYDDLLETALGGLRRHTTLVVGERDVAKTGTAESSYVVKFHGDAVTRRGIVLSRDDFERFTRQRPAMTALLEGLLLNQSFFFVGYGLRDPDFRHLYHRVAAMLRGEKRPSFATTFDEPTSHQQRQWKIRHIDLIDIPGRTYGDKSRRLLHFLDTLSERVTEHSRLFFAEDVEQTLSPNAAELRSRLLEVAGSAVDASLELASGSASEARLLADLLRFLAERGLQGRAPNELAAAFASLSDADGLSRSERANLLILALRHTENAADAEALRQRIADLDRVD